MEKTITLTIKKGTPNPNYKEEMKNFVEYNSQNRRGYNDGFQSIPPSPIIVEDLLIVDLTQGQFEAIKKAVLEKF